VGGVPTPRRFLFVAPRRARLQPATRIQSLLHEATERTEIARHQSSRIEQEAAVLVNKNKVGVFEQSVEHAEHATHDGD